MQQKGSAIMSESLITKKAIATGMKELAKKKNFDKITVSDITEACGLNRQTFYYHFQDKFELVNWIYYNELILNVTDQLTYDNCTEKVLQMLQRMKEEEYFYVNTLKASVKNEFEEYLLKVTCELFCEIIGRIAKKNIKLDEDEIRFIAEFYSYGITGTITAWVSKGMKETPEYIATQLRKLALGTGKFAITRYFERKKSHESDH